MKRPQATKAASTSAPLTLTPAVLANDARFLWDLCRSGAGITALPAGLADQDVASGRLVEVLPTHALGFEAWLYLVHRPGPYLPAPVRAFRDTVLELVRDRPVASAPTRRPSAKHGAPRRGDG